MWIPIGEIKRQKNQQEWDGVQEAELSWNNACHVALEGRINMGAKLKEACSRNETPARKGQSYVDLGAEKYRLVF